VHKIGSEGVRAPKYSDEELEPFIRAAEVDIQEIMELNSGAAVIIKGIDPVPDYTVAAPHARDTVTMECLRRQLAEARIVTARKLGNQGIARANY
jgi:hypothetical protein